MVALIGLKRRATQPQQPLVVDWSHPSSAGLTNAYSGANIGWNAAKNQFEAVTGLGTGFAQRGTPYGRSLRTSSAGWASIATNADWLGPNTVIMLVYINSVAASFGGITAKITSGTTTQLSIGRDAGNDFMAFGVDNATTGQVSQVNLSALIGKPSVISYTHSGVASTGATSYLDGRLLGTTTNLGTQPSGTGPLLLGMSRDQTASFAGDIDFLLFLRFNRVLSAAEIASLSSDATKPWQIFSAGAA